MLQAYTVQVMRASSSVVIHSSMVDGNQGSDVIMGLEAGPYSITVVARTGAGEGNVSNPVAFTLTAVSIIISK